MEGNPFNVSKHEVHGIKTPLSVGVSESSQTTSMNAQDMRVNKVAQEAIEGGRDQLNALTVKADLNEKVFGVLKDAATIAKGAAAVVKGVAAGAKNITSSLFDSFAVRISRSSQGNNGKIHTLLPRFKELFQEMKDNEVKITEDQIKAFSTYMHLAEHAEWNGDKCTVVIDGDIYDAGPLMAYYKSLCDKPESVSLKDLCPTAENILEFCGGPLSGDPILTPEVAPKLAYMIIFLKLSVRVKKNLT